MQISSELIKACKEKQRLAQKQLYSELLPYLNAVCRRYLTNPADAKDSLQEAFINIFSKIDQYNPERSQFKTWAVKITINCALKYNEKMFRIPLNDLSNDQPDQSIDPKVLEKLSDEDLMLFFKKMPPQYFEVFNLHAIDGFSHKEIAELLSIQESLSRKRMSRARNWLSTNSGDFLIENPGLKKSI